VGVDEAEHPANTMTEVISPSKTVREVISKQY
jgi:hypothetical protein